jgi:hypothetical protein
MKVKLRYMSDFTQCLYVYGTIKIGLDKTDNLRKAFLIICQCESPYVY